MLYNYFSLISRSQWCCDFLRDVSYLGNGDNSIHLVSCTFNKSLYDPALFSELNIYFPNEIKKSLCSRQAEFLAGRFAAKQALHYFGFHSYHLSTIYIGKQREPVWPQNIVGSITHNEDIALCAISERQSSNFIGIDIENHLSDEVSLEIENQIHTLEEKSLLVKNLIPENVATTLIFSAKESLFKALHSVVKSYFDFSVAKIVGINLTKGELDIELMKYFSIKYNLRRNYCCHFELKSYYIITLVCA